jgi:hypothetical protein
MEEQGEVVGAVAGATVGIIVQETALAPVPPIEVARSSKDGSPP